MDPSPTSGRQAFRRLTRRCQGEVLELDLFRHCACGCLTCSHEARQLPPPRQRTFDRYERTQQAFVQLDRTRKPGLFGSFYSAPNLHIPKSTMVIEKLEHLWRKERTVRSNTWSGQRGGYLVAPVSGEVTFHAEADYGATLEIDGTPVIHWFGEAGLRSGSSRSP